MGVFRLSEGRGLHLDELSVGGDMIRPLMISPMWWLLVQLLADQLLLLQDLA
jgi:hypothetical protein